MIKQVRRGFQRDERSLCSGFDDVNSWNLNGWCKYSGILGQSYFHGILIVTIMMIMVMVMVGRMLEGILVLLITL